MSFSYAQRSFYVCLLCLYSFKYFVSLRVGEVLKGDECMYAISQGAMAVECRSFDLETLDLLSPLTHRDTLVQCLSERALLRTLEGGCSVPIAVSSQVGNWVTRSSPVT